MNSSEAFFSLLTWTSQRERRRLNIAMSSFLEYLDWNEFWFESYMSRLHLIASSLKLCTFSNIVIFVHWFADLTYLQAWYFDRVSSDDILIELCMLCKQTLSWAVNRSIWRLRLFLLLILHDERNFVLCARSSAIITLVNARFMLYFLIVCYEIHVKLTHFNFVDEER